MRYYFDVIYTVFKLLMKYVFTSLSAQISKLYTLELYVSHSIFVNVHLSILILDLVIIVLKT